MNTIQGTRIGKANHTKQYEKLAKRLSDKVKYHDREP